MIEIFWETGGEVGIGSLRWVHPKKILSRVKKAINSTGLAS